MSYGLVAPVGFSGLFRFLVGIQADAWGPEWLKRWLTDADDPQVELYRKIARSIAREPQNWTRNRYGITNHEDKIGVYTGEGPQSVAVAVDHDKQLYPPPYWRWILHLLAEIHSDYLAAAQADTIGKRL